MHVGTVLTAFSCLKGLVYLWDIHEMKASTDCILMFSVLRFFHFIVDN